MDTPTVPHRGIVIYSRRPGGIPAVITGMQSISKSMNHKAWSAERVCIYQSMSQSLRLFSCPRRLKCLTAKLVPLHRIPQRTVTHASDSLAKRRISPWRLSPADSGL